MLQITLPTLTMPMMLYTFFKPRRYTHCHRLKACSFLPYHSRHTHCIRCIIGKPEAALCIFCILHVIHFALCLLPYHMGWREKGEDRRERTSPRINRQKTKQRNNHVEISFRCPRPAQPLVPFIPHPPYAPSRYSSALHSQDVDSNRSHQK